MNKGTHQYESDSRNKDIKISINGEMFSRDEAKISVFDSGFLLGDGVWEGIRLHNEKLCFLEEHLTRLYDGAKSIDMHIEKNIKEYKELDELYKKNELLKQELIEFEQQLITIKEKESKKSGRGYHLMEHYGTSPNVIYLKKIEKNNSHSN